MPNLTDIRQRTWDFALTVITVVLLGGLGVQSFIGTIYVWWAQRTLPDFAATGQARYIEVMNAIAAPQLILLVLVMGLCVPKRLFSRAKLVTVSLAMVAAGAIAGAYTGRLSAAVTVYLSLAALIQVAVVALTAAGTRGPSYLTEGRLTKLGSGLLHLGFIVFGIVVAALQKSPFMLPVFWTSTVLMVGGTALSFYADRLAFRRRRPQIAEQPAEGPIEF